MVCAYTSEVEYAEFIAENEEAEVLVVDSIMLPHRPVQQWVDSQPQNGVYTSGSQIGQDLGERTGAIRRKHGESSGCAVHRHLVSQEIVLDERLTYYADRDWRSGAGTMQYTAKDGEQFTVRELAEKAIRTATT